MRGAGFNPTDVLVSCQIFLTNSVTNVKDLIIANLNGYFSNLKKNFHRGS